MTTTRRPRTTLPKPAALALLALCAAAACAGDQAIERPTPLLRSVPVEYPLELWDRDIEGETLVRVKVNDTGGVDVVEILESSGYPAFDSAAVAGARELRFEPARRGGKRIDVWARVPILFTKRPRGGGDLR
mgnify:CR=1 FL=1